MYSIHLPAFFVKVLVGPHALPAASKTLFPSHFSVEIQNLVRNVIQFQIQRYETVNFLLESGENIKYCNFLSLKYQTYRRPIHPGGQQLSDTQPHTKIFLTVTTKLPVRNFDMLQSKTELTHLEAWVDTIQRFVPNCPSKPHWTSLHCVCTLQWNAGKITKSRLFYFALFNANSGALKIAFENCDKNCMSD